MTAPAVNEMRRNCNATKRPKDREVTLSATAERGQCSSSARALLADNEAGLSGGASDAGGSTGIKLEVIGFDTVAEDYAVFRG